MAKHGYGDSKLSQSPHKKVFVLHNIITNTLTVDIAKGFIDSSNLGLVVIILSITNKLDTLLADQDFKGFISDLIITSNSREHPIYNLGYLLFVNNTQLNNIIAKIDHLPDILSQSDQFIRSALGDSADEHIGQIRQLYYELHPQADTGMLGDHSD